MSLTFKLLVNMNDLILLYLYSVESVVTRLCNLKWIVIVHVHFLKDSMNVFYVYDYSIVKYGKKNIISRSAYWVEF